MNWPMGDDWRVLDHDQSCVTDDVVNLDLHAHLLPENTNN